MSHSGRRPSRVGKTPLARHFFAGHYAKVVESTFDAGRELDLDDVAFVVGALAFLGRVEDAQMCFDGLRWRGSSEPRVASASRFFLGIAYARAGDFERARKLLVDGALADRRSDDPWIVGFVFQGLALYRYFTGRYRASARHGLRALRAAHVARFGYMQMLANDLRGHALAQLGHYRAGIELLERAKVHSEQLGFGMNAYAIECSIANYAAEHVARPEALRRIEDLVARDSHDGYSKRALLAESAIQLALRGRRTEALAALDAADRDALRTGARRAKVVNLIARLHVLRWSQGADACAELLPQAHGLVDDGDVAFRAELLGFEAFVGRARGDRARYEDAMDRLEKLARANEHYRTRAALEQFEETPRPARPFAEDELTPLLGDVVRRDRRVIERLFGLGLTGPLPEALGLAPSRRILLFVPESMLVVEDHGELLARPSPPRWCATLLHVLARDGGASKADIALALWGLRIYRPERHDALIRTTIHRLRALVGARGVDWIVVTDVGYACTVPVHLVGADVDSPRAGQDDDLDEFLDAPSDADDEVPADELLHTLPPPRLPAIAASLASARPSASTASTASRRPPPAGLSLDAPPEARVLDKLLGMTTPASIHDLTRALGLSESTIQRALRLLLAKKRVVRMGHARSTRYEARR